MSLDMNYDVMLYYLYTLWRMRKMQKNIKFEELP